MKALTVAQPWAWALIFGNKRIENRNWSTTYRGPLLIHAGKSTKFWVDTLPHGTKPPERPALPFGVLLGIVDLIDCVPYEEVKDDPYAIAGMICWKVANPRPVEQVACQGLMAIFEVPDDLIKPACK
jgi:hypothetical protein